MENAQTLYFAYNISFRQFLKFCESNCLKRILT